MERKEFLKSCGFLCLGGSAIGSMLTSCGGMKMMEGQIDGSDIELPIATFQKKDNSYRKYVVVHNKILEYPICVYRFSEKDYSAVLMRCTHQGAELDVFGDRLQCPAHGSEFNNRGLVLTGPADQNLRSFPVSISGQQIKISLK